MHPLTLVLGSGGARGLAFLGVIRVLTAAGIPVHHVVGSSMGAILGAAYCSGMDVEAIFEIASRWRARHFLGLRLFGTGLFSHRAAARLIQHLVPASSFEDLRIPLTVVCTDIERGEPVAFRSGLLVPAVVGSSLAAGFFEPILHEGRYLVDGGYTQAVPVAFAPPDSVVLAVDPSVRPDWPLGLAQAGWWSRLWRGRWVYLQVLKSFDTLIYRLVSEQLAHRPHLRVVPALGDMKFFDFHRGREAVAAGEQAARAMLPALHAALAAKAAAATGS